MSDIDSDADAVVGVSISTIVKDTIDGHATSTIPPPPPTLPPSSATFDRYFTPLNENNNNNTTGTLTIDTSSQQRTRDVVTPTQLQASTTTNMTTTAAMMTTSSSVVSSSSTPTQQLSPATLSSLRGISSSPSNSQVSTGSINPTLLNSVLSNTHKRHYDLTPVTRNTSSDIYCCETTKTRGQSDHGIITITPSSDQHDTNEEYLHGEHLAFPSDLSSASLLLPTGSSSNPNYHAGAGAGGGLTMPPLQPIHTARSSLRRNSSQQLQNTSTVDNTTNAFGSMQNENDSNFLHMDTIFTTTSTAAAAAATLQYHHHDPVITTSTGTATAARDLENTTNNINSIFVPAVLPPIDLSSTRKYHTFTTREEYLEACRYNHLSGDSDDDDDLFVASDDDDDDDDDDNNNIHRKPKTHARSGSSPRFIPYAPSSRPANFGIEQVPEEELKRIFITRNSSSSNNNAKTNNDNENVNNESAMDASQYDSIHAATATTNTNTTTIPFGPMRIPSLHMARQLQHDSTTSISYTDQEDEDSIVVRVNGDNNNMYAVDNNDSFTTTDINNNDDASLSSYGSHVNLQSLVTGTDDIGNNNNNNNKMQMDFNEEDMINVARLQLEQRRRQRRRRKRKQQKKEQEEMQEQQAMIWLQSLVEANNPDHTDIAEAASSKFLTQTTLSNTTVIPLQRQMSVPANIHPSSLSSSAIYPTKASADRK